MEVSCVFISKICCLRNHVITYYAHQYYYYEGWVRVGSTSKDVIVSVFYKNTGN